MTAKGPLGRVADRIDDGLSMKAVWSAIHGECGPSDDYDAYSSRLGDAFQSLRKAADCSSMTYLSAVLRKRFGSHEAMSGLLRKAERLWLESQAPAAPGGTSGL
jgi:hypothetical protein